MADEIELAIRECIAARSAAAAPLVFSDEAFDEANRKTESQFRANLPTVGWDKAREALLLASTLFGSVAKDIARFHNPDAKVISLLEAASARVLMEQECKFRLARKHKKDPGAVKVSDGLICG